MARIKSSARISHDWLENAVLSVCQKSFPTEHHLTVDSITPLNDSLCPHQDYTFFLRSNDAEFRILLRLYYGFFSFWGGTDDTKAGREYSVLRHVYRQGFQAPFSYGFSGSCLPFGRPYLVLDPGDGERWEEFQESFRDVQEKIIDSLAEEMIKLHSNISSGNSVVPEVYIEEVLQQLWARVSSLKDKDLTQGFKGCLQQINNMEPMEPVLLHGSLDLYNVLIQNDYVRTVMNWEHAAIGDPRWDIAYTKLSIQQSSDRTLANRFVESYARQAGYDLQDLHIWEGLVALRMYALARWLRSLDERSLFAVAGLHSNLLEQEDFYKEKALGQFG